jgi:hypothetical protein
MEKLNRALLEKRQRQGVFHVVATFVGLVRVKKGFALYMNPNGDYIGTGYGYFGLHPVLLVLKTIEEVSLLPDPPCADDRNQR